MPPPPLNIDFCNPAPKRDCVTADFKHREIALHILILCHVSEIASFEFTVNRQTPRQDVQNNRFAVNCQSSTACAKHDYLRKCIHRPDVRNRSRCSERNRRDIPNIPKRRAYKRQRKLIQRVQPPFQRPRLNVLDVVIHIGVIAETDGLGGED